MNQTQFQVGDRVEIRIPDDHDLYRTEWWPKKGTRVTGTVQKLFKNGKIAIAIDQLGNKSEDRKHTINWRSIECLIPLS